MYIQQIRLIEPVWIHVNYICSMMIKGPKPPFFSLSADEYEEVIHDLRAVSMPPSSHAHFQLVKAHACLSNGQIGLNINRAVF